VFKLVNVIEILYSPTSVELGLMIKADYSKVTQVSLYSMVDSIKIVSSPSSYLLIGGRIYILLLPASIFYFMRGRRNLGFILVVDTAIIFIEGAGDGITAGGIGTTGGVGVG
jgi:hypothetical protein